MSLSLVELRLNRGLTLREVAMEVGIDHTVLWRAERGSRPRPAVMKLIADFYGVKVTDVFPAGAGWDGSERRGSSRDVAA